MVFDYYDDKLYMMLFLYPHEDRQLCRGGEGLPVCHPPVCPGEAAVCGEEPVGHHTGVCGAVEREGPHHCVHRPNG